MIRENPVVLVQLSQLGLDTSWGSCNMGWGEQKHYPLQDLTNTTSPSCPHYPSLESAPKTQERSTEKSSTEEPSTRTAPLDSQGANSVSHQDWAAGLQKSRLYGWGWGLWFDVREKRAKHQLQSLRSYSLWQEDMLVLSWKNEKLQQEGLRLDSVRSFVS